MLSSAAMTGSLNIMWLMGQMNEAGVSTVGLRSSSSSSLPLLSALLLAGSIAAATVLCMDGNWGRDGDVEGGEAAASIDISSDFSTSMMRVKVSMIFWFDEASVVSPHSSISVRKYERISVKRRAYS